MSEQFREGSSLVMFTSDVSARGMDYPGLLASGSIKALSRLYQGSIEALLRLSARGMDYPGLLALRVQKYAKVSASNVVLERACERQALPRFTCVTSTKVQFTSTKVLALLVQKYAKVLASNVHL